MDKPQRNQRYRRETASHVEYRDVVQVTPTDVRYRTLSMAGRRIIRTVSLPTWYQWAANARRVGEQQQ